MIFNGKTDVNFNVPITSDVGHRLEVYLDYPDNLHDSHSDFALFSENIPVGEIKQCKSVPNLNDKKKYILHHIIYYKNLLQ